MQIQCYHCHNPMVVNPQGGQFQCPTCRAVNSVGVPVGPGVPPAQPVQHPQYAAAPPPPKKDNRKAYVLGAFMVLGAVALTIGWWGVLIGLPLLAWGIAGAMGKITSPGALVFPESAGKIGVAALGIALGGFVTTCGVMGGASQAEEAKREVVAVQEKAKREAADNAAKEKREAEAAAAKAAHKAELLANVGKAATDYKAGLDAVEVLVNEDKMKDASAKMGEVTAGVAEYLKLDPVPDEIAALMPRGIGLDTQITEALKIIVAAENLDKNMAKATELTKGTKDGAAWSTAQGLWQAALQDIKTLEAAEEAQASRVPAGLPGKRKAIEKKLSKADGIVTKYEEKQAEEAEKLATQEAEQAAYRALCGDKPTCGGGWDGECVGSEYAFKQVANDPSDVDVENCSAPVLTGDDCWHSTCTVLARNGFGAMVRQKYVFRFSKLGAEVVGNAR